VIVVCNTNDDHGHGLLIQFIRDELGKKEEWQKSLQKIRQEENRPYYGLKFTAFSSQEARDKFVSKLVLEINKVNEYLALVAGRHHERHKELVSLLVEQFEIEKELEKKDPIAAGGFFHETCARERLEEIKKRIKEIVHAKSVC